MAVAHEPSKSILLQKIMEDRFAGFLKCLWDINLHASKIFRILGEAIKPWEKHIFRSVDSVLFCRDFTLRLLPVLPRQNLHQKSIHELV